MRPHPIPSTLAVILLVVLGAPDLAGALDCEAPPDNSPVDFAEGTAVGHDGDPFFDGQSYVVIGEVVEVSEPDADGAPEPSPPEVTVKVAAAIGRTDVDSTVILSNDETWGPNYRAGDHHLFIVNAPDQPAQMQIDVCYFGHEVEDATALADELEPIAEAADTPFVRPADEPDRAGTWPWLVVGAGGIALGLVAVAALVMRRRSSRG
ncbi:MAG: hypothetical protein ACLFWR_08735 [Acidimicrobiales bacterium]